MIGLERCSRGRTSPGASVTSIRTDSWMASSLRRRLSRWKPTCCPGRPSGTNAAFARTCRFPLVSASSSSCAGWRSFGNRSIPLITERDTQQLRNLAGDMLERVQAAHLNLDRTTSDPGWGGAHAPREAQLLSASFTRTETAVRRLCEQMRDASSESGVASLKEVGRGAFEALAQTVRQVADLNDRSASTLPRSAQRLRDHPERTIAAAGPLAHSRDTNTY